MKFKPTHLLLALIILIASFLRLYRISDHMEFLGDQDRDVVIARQFLKNGDPFFIGPQTSIGNMYLGPFYYYLVVVPGLILTWFNPVGPAIIVAILGIITVFLIYRISLSWFGASTALIAAFMYAISPVVIKYSNFSWNPNILPLFSLLFVYFLYIKRPKLASLSFIMAINAHYLALALLPVGFLIWVWQGYQSKFPKSYIVSTAIAVVLFILSLTPQILFDIKHNGQNFKALSTFFTQRETTVNLKPYKALPELPGLFNQINTRLLAGKNEAAGVYLSYLFAFLLLVYLYQSYRRKKLDVPVILLIVWYLSGIIALALYKQHVYDHYFGFLFPVVIILFAYLLTRLPRIIWIIPVISVSYLSIIETPIRWNPPKQLSTTRAIVDSINQASQGQPFNFGLLAKMNYDPGYKYFFYESNSPIYEINQKLTEQLFVVCEPFQMNCNPLNNPEWSIAAFGIASIDKQWEINGIKVFRMVHTANDKKSN